MDMRDNARLAIQFLGRRDVAAVASEIVTLYALDRAIEIVGEAASKIDPAQRSQFQAIPWRFAIDMRNLLIHGYDHVRVAYVVDTVRKDFLPLIAENDRILNAGGAGQA